MKRIICLALSLLMIFATIALTSCATKNDTVISEPPPTTDPPYLSGLDFEDATIKFALSQAVNGNPPNIAYKGFDVDEKTGDVVADAVFDRNATIEEQLNVNIEIVLCTGHTEFTENVLPALMAGDDEYDVLAGQQANDIDLCLEGYLFDINKLPDHINNIDSDAEWWAADYMDYYQYKNELYWLSSPLSLMYAGGASCIFVNARLYDSHFGESHGNIYDFVKEGKWTIDVMAEMCSKVYKDTDQSESLTSSDIFGTWFQSSWSKMEVLVGCGLECSSKNADGSINFDIIHTNEKYINMVQKVYNIFSNTLGMSKDQVWDFEPFRNGNQLFLFGELNTLETLREMNDDFYLIPTPKLDLTQSEYRSAMVDGNQILGISYTCKNVGATTATLDLMAYLSDRDVTSLYFDEVLKYKYSRDDATAEMVDLVHDSVYTDFVLIWERWLWDDHWLRYGGFQPNLTSIIKKSQEKWLTRFNDTLAKLDELAAIQYDSSIQ